MTGISALVAVVFLYALVSRRLERTSITAPMVFVAAGVLLGPSVLGVAQFELESEAMRLGAEIALVLVLFTDATRVGIPVLVERPRLPARLLGMGMPLTIALGTIVAVSLLPGFSFWEAAIVGTVLAPTDAALGQAVVNNRQVPAAVRQALNVEAGLNDGLSVPFLALFLGLAGFEAGFSGPWYGFALAQIGLGALAGAGVGAAGALLVRRAARMDFMTDAFERLAVLAIAVAAWGVAGLIGGNGFIAAFVGGLCAGPLLGEMWDRILIFTEAEGQLLNLTVFFVFGAAAIPLLAGAEWQVFLYALLSLTVIRMLPVALALLGTGLRGDSALFLGWFGPRGLASIILALLVVESTADAAVGTEILEVVAVTVLMSVLLHGLTAAPLSAIYGRWSDDMHPSTPEKKPATEVPSRMSGAEEDRP